jgi:hypothetical protein
MEPPDGSVTTGFGVEYATFTCYDYDEEKSVYDRLSGERFRCGWPFYLFEGSVWLEERMRIHRVFDNSWFHRFISLPRAPSSLGKPKVRATTGVPIDPLFVGATINTAFYTITLWLLIPGPFVLRRAIRIKRGRCPKCGYDLRGQLPGAGCPECGWGRSTT